MPDSSTNPVDVVIRHPRERKSKCSLEPLRARPDLTFHTAKPGFRFCADGYLLLSINGSPLSVVDASLPLLLLDSTWRLLPRLEACVEGKPHLRRLPDWVPTAYPRVSKTAIDPQGGLASVEALYIARRLLGRRDDSLLRDYYWRDDFLQKLEGVWPVESGG